MSQANFQFKRMQDYKLHQLDVTKTCTVRTGTATYDMNIDNPVVVKSPAATTTITVPDGAYIGQTLLLSDYVNASSSAINISVTHHVTSDPETFTMSTVDQWLLLVWTGTEWATVAGDATAT